jgi:hypothetical protein
MTNWCKRDISVLLTAFDFGGGYTPLERSNV